MANPSDRAAELLSTRILATGVVTAVAAAATLVVTNTINVVLLDSRVTQFTASEEQTVFTWAAASATFAAAFAALLHVVAGLRDVRVYAATAALLAFFSLDDMVQIHERLGDRLAEAVDAPSYVGSRAWMFIYAPLLAAAFALLWLVVRRMEEPIRRHAVVGAALLLVGVFLEGVGIGTNRLLESGTETPHLLRAGVEEAAELAAWILIASALAASLFRRLGADDQWQRPEPASVNPSGSTGTNRQS